jgi:Ca-activated chloride channel family protein
MSFLAPLALAGLLFLPVVVAMYLLKLRRDEAPVPSTLLWQRLVADVEANAPWQRLRRSLLLLLQLLLVILLAVLAARPFLEHEAGLARDIVLVIDTSASMQATDVAPDRLEAAKTAAIDALRDLPAGGRVSVIAAGRTARVVANGTDDLGHVRQAIGGIEATSDVGDLGDALRLASALAARSGDAEIVVATDGALATPPTGTLDAPVRVLRVGRDAANQAIVALAVSTAPSGLSHSAFISVANLGLDMAQRRIEVYADGQLREARTLTLDPQRRTDVSIDDIDDPQHPASVIEVRLVAADEAGPGQPTDALAVDDRAWAIVPSSEPRQILLAGEPDPYLETALSYLPGTELYYRSGDDWSSLTGLDQFELVILNRFLPDQLPAKPILAIAPPASSELGAVTGMLTNPGIGSLDASDPILRYVDLSTTHIAEAQRLELPAWARTVIPGPGSAPLLYAGQLAGRPAAVLAFEPRRSDLPLQVAFPVLIANLAGELMGGSGAPATAIAPGTPVTLPIPAGAGGVRVERPDGSVDELVAPALDATSVTFARTDLLGVYTVTPIEGSSAPDASGSSPGEGTPGATDAANGPASPAASAPAAVPAGPTRFAVDLLDVNESNIAPGDGAALVALGPAAGPGASPGQDGAPAADRPSARDELWIPIVLIALLVLTAEWLVYERDTLGRLRRAVTARRRRGRGVERGA